MPAHDACPHHEHAAAVPALLLTAWYVAQAGINICLVMISRQQPAAQGLLGLMPGVVPIACPAYSTQQLVDILSQVGGCAAALRCVGLLCCAGMAG